jgi:membrane-associated phospholipid phosphatase
MPTPRTLADRPRSSEGSADVRPDHPASSQRATPSTVEGHRSERLGERPSFLEPRPGGSAERLAERADRRPVRVAIAMWATAFVAYTAALTGLGLLLVHPLGHGALARWETRAENWVVGERTSGLSRVLTPGTWIGSTEVIIGIAFVVGLVLVLRRRLRDASLVALALTLEASVFGATQFLVQRDRPSIPKLEQVAPTASFPSGHLAASIALYLSIALVVSDRVRSRAVRIIAWAWALLAPMYCMVSRFVRGAHHPTDLMASLLLGLASVALGVWAVRTAVAAYDARRLGSPRSPGSSGSSRSSRRSGPEAAA